MYGGETSPGWKWDANIRTWIEVRHDLDEAETLIWVLVWRWDVNVGPWIGIEMQPRLGRDANLWTLMETVHGWRRDKNLVTWISLSRTRMEVWRTYWNLDGFEMVPVWIWDATWEDWNGGETSPCCYSEANIWTWIEVRHDLDGIGIGLGWSWCAILVTWMEVTCDLEWGETPNSRPGTSWDVTWMEVRFESSHLDTDDTVHMHILRRGSLIGWYGTRSWDIRTWVEVKRNLGEWPGWRWDRALIEVYIHLQSWVEVRRDLDEVTYKYQDMDGVETLSGGRCDVITWTWIGLRQYMYGGETKIFEPDPDEIGPEWRWDTYLESLMGLWGCLYGAEMQLWCPGWGWDVTWMEMRYKHKDLDWGEKPHGWKRGVNQSTWGWWDVNLETWMRMRWELDWVETHILRPGWDRTIKELRFIYCGIDD